MKVILNQDVKHLGEEGDVKVVANGYARNYLFPRNLALPYNNMTVAYFESRKEEIESRKEEKRRDAASLKDKLEAFTVELFMPAGPNGKLYGAVTNQTIADELLKAGFEIERKRIEVPGLTIKSVGKYHAFVRLYETSVAEISVTVSAQNDQEKTKAASKNEATKPEPKSAEEKTEDSTMTAEPESAEA